MQHLWIHHNAALYMFHTLLQNTKQRKTAKENTFEIFFRNFAAEIDMNLYEKDCICIHSFCPHFDLGM